MALGRSDAARRIESGEEVVVFDASIAGKRLKGPWNFRGRVFKVTDDASRSWTVSLVKPGGGAMWFLNSDTGMEKDWRTALTAASGG